MRQGQSFFDLRECRIGALDGTGMPQHRRRICRVSGSGMAERLRADRGGNCFSLVELVIVVVILGVIAAIAVPRLARGVTGAGDSSLRKNLQALRTAIDAYSAEHGGAFPGATADGMGGAAETYEALRNQLTKFSNAAGQCSETGGASYPYGPYLQQIPVVPVGPNKGNAAVAIDKVNSPPLVTAGPEGWVYNPLTGQIHANTDRPNETGTRTWDEY
jgi:prepilin-type N-terminal cleavage/methylation domain-containing protein